MAKKITSITDYRENFIDYYNQYLGLPALSETGIDVEETDVEEDIALAPPRDERDDELNIFSGSIVAGEGSEREISFGLPSITPYNSYKDALKAAGLQDRTPFFNNIVDPLVGGTPKDAEILEQAGARVDATTPKKEVVKKGIAKVASVAVPIAGGVIGAGLTTGKPVTNAFGKASFRPSGPLGGVSDLVHAMQYRDIQEIRNAQATGAADQGFAMALGNYGITRRPGSGAYTGNTRGLSHDHIKSLEAISKGFVPSTYSFDGKPSKFLPDFLKPQVNVSIEGSGGSFADPSNRMGGFYTADGKFYDPKTNTTSSYGLASSRDNLARTNGITDGQADMALEMARRGEMTLADAIASIKGGGRDDDYTSPEEKGLGAGAPSAGDTYTPPEAELGAGAGDENFGGDEGFAGSPGSSGQGDAPGSEMGTYAKGGRVGLQMGGTARTASGFVERPPEQVSEGQTVADNVNTQLPEGAFVINAAAVEFAGSNDVKKMLLDAHKEAVRRGITVDKQGDGAKMIDVAISRGEVVVAPHLAKIIGYDRLNKINNRGKRETSERIRENGQGQPGMAEGGFLMPEPRPYRPRLEALADVELRADLEEYIQNDPLARLGFNLYEKGDVDVKAIVLPSEDLRVKVAGLYTPAQERENPIEMATKFEGFVEQQQGPGKEKRDVAGVHYFAGDAKNYDRHMSNLTLLHELRHHAMRYLSQEYDMPMPVLSREETVFDVQDYINRMDARKVKPSIPKESKSKEHQIRKRHAYTMPSANKELAFYQERARDALRDRKVPERVKSKEVEGFLDRAMDFLGLK